MKSVGVLIIIGNTAKKYFTLPVLRFKWPVCYVRNNNNVYVTI